MSRKVAIIGLGPAGAYAAKAASDAGCEVDVYTFGEAKPAPGAFWLHWLPEDLAKTHKHENIYVMGKGDAPHYGNLQWGDSGLWGSFPEKPYWTKGWDFQKIFYSLLPMRCQVHQTAFPLSDTDIKDLSSQYDRIFQTFPKKMHLEIRPKKVPFVAAMAETSGEEPNNVVVYNGTGEGIVVREAVLFGNHYLEFPKGMSQEEVWSQHPLGEEDWKFVTLKDLHPATKPVQQDPGYKVQLVGRWAEWNSKRLSHEVYKIVQDILEEE